MSDIKTLEEFSKCNKKEMALWIGERLFRPRFPHDEKRFNLNHRFFIKFTFPDKKISMPINYIPIEDESYTDWLYSEEGKKAIIIGLKTLKINYNAVLQNSPYDVEPLKRNFPSECYIAMDVAYALLNMGKKE